MGGGGGGWQSTAPTGPPRAKMADQLQPKSGPKVVREREHVRASLRGNPGNVCAFVCVGGAGGGGAG